MRRFLIALCLALLMRMSSPALAQDATIDYCDQVINLYDEGTGSLTGTSDNQATFDAEFNITAWLAHWSSEVDVSGANHSISILSSTGYTAPFPGTGFVIKDHNNTTLYSSNTPPDPDQQFSSIGNLDWQVTSSTDFTLVIEYDLGCLNITVTGDQAYLYTNLILAQSGNILMLILGLALGERIFGWLINLFRERS